MIAAGAEGKLLQSMAPVIEGGRFPTVRCWPINARPFRCAGFAGAPALALMIIQNRLQVHSQIFAIFDHAFGTAKKSHVPMGMWLYPLPAIIALDRSGSSRGDTRISARTLERRAFFY